jgi:TolA-binding protein
LGQKEKAYQVFKELGERYPNSEEAKQVLDWLALCKE